MPALQMADKRIKIETELWKKQSSSFIALQVSSGGLESSAQEIDLSEVAHSRNNLRICGPYFKNA